MKQGTKQRPQTLTTPQRSVVKIIRTNKQQNADNSCVDVILSAKVSSCQRWLWALPVIRAACWWSHL